MEHVNSVLHIPGNKYLAHVAKTLVVMKDHTLWKMELALVHAQNTLTELKTRNPARQWYAMKNLNWCQMEIVKYAHQMSLNQKMVYHVENQNQIAHHIIIWISPPIHVHKTYVILKASC